MKGAVSIQVAVLLGIAMFIAVAVGWYLYTTAMASASSQPRLSIIGVEVSTAGQLTLRVANPGPQDVQISAAEVQGRQVPLNCGGNNVVAVGQSATCTGTVSGIQLTVGATLSGRLILASGQSLPFNTVVKS